MKELNKVSYYLAVDIGASSGRHILGWIENDKICIEEIYRFENKLIKKNDHLCWNLPHLISEIIEGMKHCKRKGKIPKSMAIDTWGVDFVLLDSQDEIIGDAVSYRDSRTQGIDKILYESIKEEELYSRNGIQKQIFNSIYQLYAIKMKQPENLKNAQSFLMIPEYLNFVLTGQKKNEYTNATTTQLVNAIKRDWDWGLIERLGLPAHIFGEIFMPETSMGSLKKSMQDMIGFDTEVVLTATHDTASAVAAVPASNPNSMYLSSGTWSLLGIERREPDCSKLSRLHNFTNEGGYKQRYRYLKNIMGLWMMQSIKKEFSQEYSFAEIYEFADRGRSCRSIVDVKDEMFLAPINMSKAVQEYCAKTNQEVPKTKCEIVFCIYNSLAKCYSDTVKEVEVLVGHEFEELHIVGGGCQDWFLNKLTAEYVRKPVYAGPIEATALGNISVQMIKSGQFKDLMEARKYIKKSFDIREVEITFQNEQQ